LKKGECYNSFVITIMVMLLIALKDLGST